MDRISIRDLRVETRVGVSDQERGFPQTIAINVDIAADLSRAGTSDDLSDTVDYDETARAIAALVRSRQFNLLEHMAEKIASLVCGFEGVEGVTVEVVKEQPPIDEEVGAVAVRVNR